MVTISSTSVKKLLLAGRKFFVKKNSSYSRTVSLRVVFLTYFVHVALANDVTRVVVLRREKKVAEGTVEGY